MRVALQRPAWWILVNCLAFLVSLFLVAGWHRQIFPPCLFHLFTGLHCPGCGATRAVLELARGNLLAALQDNALFVAALPLSVWFVVGSCLRRKVLIDFPPAMLWLGFAVMLMFTVWRNLPAGVWFAPIVP